MSSPRPDDDPVAWAKSTIAATPDDDPVSWAKSVVQQPVKSKVQKLDVPAVVDDELSNLGYTDQARTAILGNVGRENNWNPNTIFQGHNDPKNRARNRGLFSWQGDRRANLEKHITQNGGDWTPNESNLRLQAQFLDKELKSPKYAGIYKTLTDPDAPLPKVSRSLRSYINYVPNEPYNTPDAEYDTKNNRIWAERALKRGLGKTDMNGLLSQVDSILGSQQQEPSDEDLNGYLSQVDAILGDNKGGQPISPTNPTPQSLAGQSPTQTEQTQPAPVATTPAPDYSNISQDEMNPQTIAEMRSPQVVPTKQAVTPPTAQAKHYVGGQAQLGEELPLDGESEADFQKRTNPEGAVPTKDGGLLTRPKTIGKENDNLNATAGIYQPPNNLSNEDALKNALLAADTTGSLTPDMATAFAKKNASKIGSAQGGPYVAGDPIHVRLQDLIDAGLNADDVKQANRAEQIQNEQPNLNLPQAKAPSFIDQASDTINKNADPITANIVGTLAGGLAGNDTYASGLLRIVNDLSPTSGESMSRAPGSKQTSENDLTRFADYLQSVGEAGQKFQRETGSQSETGQTLKGIGAGLVGLPRLMMLPGGGVVNFAVDSAATTRGAGGSKMDALKHGLIGAGLGTISEFVAPFVATKVASPILKPIAELGTVAGGTYALTKAIGDESPLINTAVMSAFHVIGMVGKARAEGKVLEVKNPEGDSIKVQIQKGKVVQVADGATPDIKVAAPSHEEMVKRAEAFSPKLTEEEKQQFADKKGNNFTFEKDLGDGKIAVTDEKGSTVIRKESNLTPINETKTEVSEPKSSVDSATLAKDQSAEGEIPKPEGRPVMQRENKGGEVDQVNQQLKNHEDAFFTEEPKTVTHPDENINGKPIIAQTAEGKVVVANPENKSGVSVVTDRSEAVPKPAEALPEPDLTPTDKGGELDTKGAEIVSQGEPQGQGVAAIKEQRDKARRAAETDDLTGLANRSALDKALPSAEADPNTSIIAFDANNFGQVNKKAGQAEGDRALKEIGSALKQAADENGVGARVFRRGGDEFVVLAPKEIAEKVRARAEEIYGDKKYGDTTVSLSGTVGENFKEADSTLQEAKAERKAKQLNEADAEGKKSGLSTEERAKNLIDLHDERGQETAGSAGEDQESAGKRPPVGSDESPERVGQGAGLKNASVEAQREERGESPLSESARRDWDTAKTDAESILDKNPKAADELITELDKKPRAVSDTEHSLLLHKYVEVRNEHNHFADELTKAVDSGDELAAAEMRTRLARTSDELDTIERASRASGTEQGRGLNIRKQMMKEDFSLAGLERQKRAALGGRALTDTERSDLQKVADDYKSKAEALEKHNQELEDKLPAEPVLRAAEKIVKSLNDRAEKARERLKKRGAVFTAGLDPVALKDLAEIGASHIANAGLDFAKWSKEMVKEFGEKIQPHLEKIFAEAQKYIESNPKAMRDVLTSPETQLKAYKTRLTTRIEDLEKQIETKTKIVSQRKPIPLDEEARNLQERHKELKIEYAKEFGEPKPVSSLDTKIKARQTALETQITRLEKEIASKQRINDVRKNPVTSNAITELESKRDALKAQRDALIPKESKPMSVEMKQNLYKRNLDRQIEAINRQIETGEKPVKGQKVPTTAEIDQLKAKRDELRAKLPAADKKISDEQYNKTRKSDLEKQISDLQKQIESKARTAQEKNARQVSPEVGKLIEQRDEIRKQFDAVFGKDISNEQRLQAFKSRAGKSIEDLTTRIANKDYAPRPKPEPVKFDTEGLKLKANIERLKKTFQRDLKRDRASQAPAAHKALDLWSKYVRAGMLSWLTTFGKLFTAAQGRMLLNLIERTMQKSLNAGLRFATGGKFDTPTTSIKAEATAIKSYLTSGMKDALLMLKNKDTDLDALMSKENYDRSALEYLGQLHGAMKAPVKRARFENSLQSQIEFGIRHGIDVTDPLNQATMMGKAYQDANRDIFMQDASLVDKYQRALRLFEARGRDGQPSLLGKSVATIGRTIFPIVKIPVNFAKEAAVYNLGVISGSVKLGLAFRKGLDNVPIEEKEAILRHFSKGSLGLAMMTWGYFNADKVGGYYQAGEKRDDKDVKAAGFRLFGIDIPRWATHLPLFEAAQVGATFRRVSDSKFRKANEETKGYVRGTLAASLGLIEEVPFVNETADLAKLLDPKQREDFVAEFAKSRLIPGISQWTASQIDKSTPFSPFQDTTKRKPETLWQHLETGIPGLRGNVPAKDLSANESPAVRAARLNKAKAGGVMDEIEEAKASSQDTKELEKVLKTKVANKLQNGTLTESEATRANQILGTKYKGQVKDEDVAPKPDLEGRYGKNADGLIDRVATWAEAVGTDPMDAFNKLLKGETIARLENGTIIIKRMSNDERDTIKRQMKAGKAMILDHTTPLEIGGTNATSNLKLVTKEEWASYSPVENYLGQALHKKKVSGADAQALIQAYKQMKFHSPQQRAMKQEIVKYVGLPFNDKGTSDITEPN